MKKALIFGLMTALTLTFMSCSDDKKSPELCSPDKYPVCDGDTLLTCNDNQRIEKEVCPKGCIGEKGNASCKQTSHPGTSDPGTSQPGHSESGCGEITAKGICDENVARVCVGDKIKTTKCSTGMHCGAGDDGVMTCLKDEAPVDPKPEQPSEWSYKTNDPCGNVTADGICSPNGDKLAYCRDDQKLEVLNCSPKCQIFDEIADCYEPCPDDLTYAGRCTDNGYEFCNDNGYHIIRTCEAGFHCGENNDGLIVCLEDV